MLERDFVFDDLLLSGDAVTGVYAFGSAHVEDWGAGDVRVEIHNLRLCQYEDDDQSRFKDWDMAEGKTLEAVLGAFDTAETTIIDRLKAEGLIDRAIWEAWQDEEFFRDP